MPGSIDSLASDASSTDLYAGSERAEQHPILAPEGGSDNYDLNSEPSDSERDEVVLPRVVGESVEEDCMLKDPTNGHTRSEPSSHTDSNGLKRKRSLDGLAESSSDTYHQKESNVALSQQYSQPASVPEQLSAHKRTKVATGVIPPRPADPLLPHDRSNLPGEIWQYIFHFIPPTSLGRLLQVNTTFHRLLTATKGQPTNHVHGENPILMLEDSEFTWIASRKLYHGGMPRPLPDLKELETWQLILGKGCQFCTRPGLVTIPLGQSSLETGAEANVQTIWPFGVRSCGPCLRAKSSTVSKHQCCVKDS